MNWTFQTEINSKEQHPKKKHENPNTHIAEIYTFFYLTFNFQRKSEPIMRCCCYYGKSIWLNGNHFLYYFGYKSWPNPEQKRDIEYNKLSILLKHFEFK